MEIQHYRRLIESAFPDISIHTCEAVVDGWDSFVLDVNSDLIFRFPRRPYVVLQQEREIRFLPELAKALPVSVPEFRMISRDGTREPSLFVGYPKIQGQPLRRDRLRNAGLRRSLARGLAQVLSALHGIPLSGLSADVFPPKDADQWRQEYGSFLEYAREHIFPLLGPHLRRSESRWWTKWVDEDANFTFDPALVHADLDPAHIICDYDRGLVAGIIDWSDAGIGDPAIDFAGLLHEPGEDFAEEVLSYYAGETGADFMSRVRYYHRLGPYWGVRFGQEHGKPEYVESGIKAIEARGR